MSTVPQEIVAYHAAGKALACELDANPFLCEFWPFEELARWNAEYQVPEYAPGFFGFATSGGGEMFAVSTTGQVVCLPFIGMAPKEAMPIANSWPAFERMLRAIQ